MSSEPQAGWQEGGVGTKEAWRGVAWAALGRELSPQPVKACYTISPDSLRSPGEPPTLPVGKAGIWGMGKGGRLKPVHFKRTSTLHTCQAQENALQNVCHRGRKRGEGIKVRGKSVPSCWEKVLEGGRSSLTFTHTCLLSQITADSPAILEVGDLGKRQGVEA